MHTYRTLPLPPRDGEPFLHTVEQAIRSGTADSQFFNTANPKLRRYIAMYEARIEQLTRLQRRAKLIVDYDANISRGARG